MFSYAHTVTLANGSSSPPNLLPVPVCRNFTLLANEDADSRGGGRYTVTEPPARRGGPIARLVSWPSRVSLLRGKIEQSPTPLNASRRQPRRVWRLAPVVLKGVEWILSAWAQYACLVGVLTAPTVDERPSGIPRLSSELQTIDWRFGG